MLEDGDCEGGEGGAGGADGAYTGNVSAGGAHIGSAWAGAVCAGGVSTDGVFTGGDEAMDKADETTLEGDSVVAGAH